MFFFYVGGWGRPLCDVAVRLANPRIIPDSTGPGHLQEERLASGSLHSLHTGYTLQEWGRGQRETRTGWECTAPCTYKINMRTLRLKQRLKTTSLFSLLGCFVSGLYLEGADWDIEKSCLVRSKPRALVSQLPILKIIPIEAHRLKLQARCFIFCIMMSWNICLEILVMCIFGLLYRTPWGLQSTPPLWGGMLWVLDWCLRLIFSPPNTFLTGYCREYVYASMLTDSLTVIIWNYLCLNFNNFKMINKVIK